MWRFNRRYFAFALLLFAIEISIAVLVCDRLVRPYVGDYLVVILVYCAIRAFLNLPRFITAACVLAFAFLIETLQYFNFVERLGLAGNALARTVLGYGFEWWDLLAYTLGTATVLILDYRFSRKSEIRANRPQEPNK